MTIEFYIKYHISEALENPITKWFFICAVFLPFLVSFFLKKPHGTILRKIGLLAFFLYAIYAMTLLDRMDTGVSLLSLDFLWTWKRAFEGSVKYQYFIVGNIMLFVPYGMVVTSLFPKEKRRWWIALLIGIATSGCIEVAQMVFHAGLCELDDVILNTIGMLVGYVVVRLCELIVDVVKSSAG